METTHKLYESPIKDKNEEKFGTVSGNQCICCMKPMADGETKMVHMNEGWMAVRSDITEDQCKELTGYNSQGWFPIGNSCAKKMPKAFVTDGVTVKKTAAIGPSMSDAAVPNMPAVIIEDLVKRHIDHQPETKLDPNTVIRFELKGISFSVSITDEGLNIYKVDNHGIGQIQITPSHSNKIIIN